MPDITVIILSYNTKAVTLECLNRLKKSIDYSRLSVETIVVENGSDGTGDFLKKNYKWVKVIAPPTNTGFARGNNLGIRAAKKSSRYFLFLNSDAWVEKETLLKAYDYAGLGHPVFSCRLNFADGRLQASAGNLPDPTNIGLWMAGLDQWSPRPVHPKQTSFFEREKKVGWVMGAFLFMNSEVVKKTLGFDENFFMYMEEVEWCRRIKQAGFEIWYTPSFSITHLDKASSGGSSFTGIVKEAKGIVYYANKYYPDKRGLIKAWVTVGMWWRWIGYTMLKKPELAGAYYQALKQL